VLSRLTKALQKAFVTLLGARVTCLPSFHYPSRRDEHGDGYGHFDKGGLAFVYNLWLEVLFFNRFLVGKVAQCSLNRDLHRNVVRKVAERFSTTTRLATVVDI
jgi:hypothetical protein